MLKTAKDGSALTSCSARKRSTSGAASAFIVWLCPTQEMNPRVVPHFVRLTEFGSQDKKNVWGEGNFFSKARLLAIKTTNHTGY